MTVTLRQIEVFLAVAEECHFGRAAERLHVSQPVVSNEIRRLERAVRADLFDRSTRTVRLTPTGQALLDDARAVTTAADTFLERASRLSTERSHHLRVASTPSVLDQLLPIVVRRAEQALPDVVVEEVPVETGEVADALVGRGCDVGVGRYVTPPPGYLAETVRDEPVYAALSGRHPLADAAVIELTDLGDLPLLLWPREQNPDYHDRLMRICADRGLEPLVLVSPPRIVGARSYLIADNRAFGLVPESTAGTLTGDIRAVPLARPATLPLSMVWLRRDPRPPITDLTALIRQVAAELSTGTAT